MPFTVSTPTGLPSRRWGTLNVIYNPAGCGGDSTDASPDYYAEGGSHLQRLEDEPERFTVNPSPNAKMESSC